MGALAQSAIEALFNVNKKGIVKEETCLNSGLSRQLLKQVTKTFTKTIPLAPPTSQAAGGPCILWSCALTILLRHAVSIITHVGPHLERCSVHIWLKGEPNVLSSR